MPDWTTTEWATVGAAAFTAVAALAAAGATFVQLFVLKRSTLPVLSGALYGHPDGSSTLVVVNGGTGVAIQPGVYGVFEGRKFGGALRVGNLLPGAETKYEFELGEETNELLPITWSCRDQDANVHIWSNDGRYAKIPRRRVLRHEGTSLRAVFARMYPDVEIPD